MFCKFFRQLLKKSVNSVLKHFKKGSLLKSLLYLSDFYDQKIRSARVYLNISFVSLAEYHLLDITFTS